MRLIRSAGRVFLAVLLLGCALFVALVVAVRQPTLRGLHAPGAPHAEAQNLREDVEVLTRKMKPRSAAHPENLRRAASMIEAGFRRAGARTRIQRFDARGANYANVIGEFGPEQTTEPVLIIGAHYDAFSERGDLPGADDNASGTAGLLELARLLGSLQPRIPVMLVAFTNEEPPFFGSEQMGSAVHARSLEEEGRPVRGMICLEMIGFFASEQHWPNALFKWIYPLEGHFIGVVGGWNDRALTRLVKRGIAATDLPVVSFTGPHQTSDASDQRSYWAHQWPAVMVTDTAYLRNPNYHTIADTAETLDYESMARVVDGVLNAALAEPD